MVHHPGLTRRCTILASYVLLQVLLLSAFAPVDAAHEAPPAFAPRLAARGALRALPRRRLRGREGGRRAHPVRLDRRARRRHAQGQRQGSADEDGRRLPGRGRGRPRAARARVPVVGRGGRGAGWGRGGAGRRTSLREDGLVWAVDPIDGTANFVDAIPLSATSVAAVECVSGNCRVVAGAVYDPYRDELFGAAYGKGAWVETAGKRTPLAVSASTLGDAIVYAGAPPGMRALKPSLRASPPSRRTCGRCVCWGRRRSCWPKSPRSAARPTSSATSRPGTRRRALYWWRRPAGRSRTPTAWRTPLTLQIAPRREAGGRPAGARRRGWRRAARVRPRGLRARLTADDLSSSGGGRRRRHGRLRSL